MPLLPRTVICRIPEHGVGAPARDVPAWISSSLGSLTRTLGGSGTAFTYWHLTLLIVINITNYLGPDLDRDRV